eukprot:TRINITY_DN18636_c0_g1_i1.p1 TRINITY_DN18636_c0_g1~~TRINITY_DN18636_c0_g1_i1.p1  ORF type:complete len:145 (+),score=30.89 TRINITY_DN18636_c0_g1_i1:43-435(+)
MRHCAYCSSPLVWAAVLVATALLLQAEQARAFSMNPCSYCKYCAFCGECSKCPCAWNTCKYCKYCKYCKACNLCSTFCEGGILSYIGDLTSLLPGGLTSPDETLDTEAIDRDISTAQRGSNAKRPKQAEL